MYILGQGPNPRKNPSSAMGRTLLGMDVAENKGGNLPLVVTLQIIPRNRKSAKQKRTTEKTEVSEGKAAINAFRVLCLTQSYSSAFTTTPNNWKEGLMGQVSTRGTPFSREETTIKRRGEKDRRAGLRPPNTSEASKKAPWTGPRTNPLW